MLNYRGAESVLEETQKIPERKDCACAMCRCAATVAGLQWIKLWCPETMSSPSVMTCHTNVLPKKNTMRIEIMKIKANYLMVDTIKR